MQHLTTTGEIIKTLGGPSKVAAALGKKLSTVGMWVTNGRFPPNTYIALHALMEPKGLSAPDELWDMAPLPASQPEAAE